jgi:hydroxymethylbilane synthase
MKKILRLGSRGSPLALLQAEETRKNLFLSHAGLADEVEIEIVPILTSGDWRPEHREQSFRELGGNKELFTKEIDEALLSGTIDMAVHSMKDVAAFLPPRMEIMAVLQRVDPRDAFIGRAAKTFEDLPQSAIVGTSSLRRQAQILALRPDLRVVSLRGNVETRLKKLADGQADATLLALAGLMRLGLQDRVSSVLPTDVILPAAAQGAIGIAARTDDDEMRNLLQAVNVQDSFVCIAAERAFLRKLDGSCHTPIGALAYYDEPGHIELEGVAAKSDGTCMVRLKTGGPADKAEQLGEELGERVRAQLPADFFAA